MNMDGIPVAVGVLKSVEVVVPNSSLESVDSKYKKGAKVAITEENAEQFAAFAKENIKTEDMIFEIRGKHKKL